MEFADGLHRLDDVVREVPPRPGGILDLTICNSNFLSDRIKDSRREWQVMSNEDPATLDFRLIFYKYRIKRLAMQPPIGFIDADHELRLKLAGLAARRHGWRRLVPHGSSRLPGPDDSQVRPRAGRFPEFPPHRIAPSRTSTMKSLEALVRDASGPVTLGGPSKMEGLAGRLGVLSRQNERYFRVCVAILVLVLLSSLGFVVLFRNQPAVIAGIFAAMGASAYGGVQQMVKLWREKVATDVAIELVEVLPRVDALKLLQEIFLKNAN